MPHATCHLRRPSRGPGLVPVDDHAAERGQHEEHQEDVQDAGPGQHEFQAVQGHQQAGQAAEQGGSGHPSRDAADQQDGERPEHRAGEPPAERVQPEQPLTDRDQQLAHLGLDHVLTAAGAGALREQAGGVPGLDQRVGVADRDPLDAVLQDAPRVLDVVGLVEDQRPRHAQPVEAQPRPERGDEQRAEPAPRPVVGHRGREPGAEHRQPAGLVGVRRGGDVSLGTHHRAQPTCDG
jgi:hypothetical protein